MLLKGLIGAWFPHFSLISQRVSGILFGTVCLWEATFSKIFITNLAQIKMDLIT
jgi:hypothetical protein